MAPEAPRTRRFGRTPYGPRLETGVDHAVELCAAFLSDGHAGSGGGQPHRTGRAPYSLRPRITGPGLEWLRDAKSVRAAGGGGDKFFGQRPKPLSGQGKGQVSVEDKRPLSLSVRRGCPPDTAFGRSGAGSGRVRRASADDGRAATLIRPCGPPSP